MVSYFLLLTPLIVWRFSPEPYLSGKILWLLLGVDFIWLCLLLRKRNVLKEELTSPRAVLQLPIMLLLPALFVGVLGVATLIAGVGNEGFYMGSFLRSNGLFILVHSIFGGVTLASVFPTKDHWLRFLQAMAVVAGLVALVGFIGKLFPLLPFVGASGYMSGTFGNSGFFAGYLLVHIGVGMMVWSNARSKRARWIWAVLVLFLIIALFFTHSRAAILAFIIGLAVLLCLSWRLLSSRVRLALGVLVALFVLAQFVPNGWLPRGVAIDQTAITSQTRLLHWRVAWEAFRAHPIIGWGRDGYATAFAQYFDPTIQQVSFGDTFNDDAHNLFLNAVVEGGVIGFLVLVFLLGSLVWFALRASRVATQEGDKWILRVAVAVVCSYAVYSFFSVDQPIVSFFFWVVYGLVFWYTRSLAVVSAIHLPGTKVRALVHYGAWGVVLGALFLSGTLTKDMFAYTSASRNLSRVQWFQWQRSIEAIPHDGWRTYRCEWWTAASRTWIAVHGRMPQDVAIAIGNTLEGHIDACTYQETDFYRTYLAAQLYTRIGDLRTPTWYQKAADMYGKAQALSPKNVQVSYGLAEVYLSQNETKKAIALLEGVREQYPEIAPTYWYLSLAYGLDKDAEKASVARAEALRRGFVPSMQ